MELEGRVEMCTLAPCGVLSVATSGLRLIPDLCAALGFGDDEG